MEICSRCGKTSEEVRLFDSLEIGLSRKMCERCSLISNTPIVKRPSTNQLKDSEKPAGVRERLMRMTHLDSGTKKELSLSEEIKKLEEQPELEKPEDLVFKLVDNFHWILQMERRRRGLTVKQLAEALNESESALNLLEKGVVPSNSFELLLALEQFLKIKLIKRDLIEQLEEKKKREAIVNSLLVHKTEEINLLPRQVEVSSKQEQEIEKLQAKPLSFRQGVIEYMKIKDLQKLNERIEKDFSFEKKTREEVGKEQVESIGKENTKQIKKNIYKTAIELKPKNTTPSIYELMKKKEEKDKEILGKDIEIVESNPKEASAEETEKPKEDLDKANWEDLE